MQPVDDAALEAAAWGRFVHDLTQHLAGQWPAMTERLGDRYGTFIERAVQQATQRGLLHAPSVARYVNLCHVWGPAFHDKPGFEWAQGILAAPPGRDWAVLHQLMQRSLRELQRLPDARIEPAALSHADARLIDTFGTLGHQGRLHPIDAAPLPRAACDLEAAELRLLDGPPLQRYELTGGDWQRVPVAAPPPLRVTAATPLPARLGLLSPPAETGTPARLQVRLRPHTTCDADVHPALAFCGPHGRWSWAGAAARAASWPVAPRDAPGAPAGPGTLIAEEASPELYRLDLDSCGLRDEGDAIGALRTLVCAWPATQWWTELQRAAPAAQSLLPGPRPWVRGSTRCRVERDGTPQDGAPLKNCFEDGLDARVAAAAQRLAAAWDAVPGLSQAGFDATLGLLTGRAACTWGWQAPVAGLEGAAWLRLVAALELQACQAALLFTGHLALGGARSRISLRFDGQAPLRGDWRRDAPAPTLAELLLPGAAVPFRFTAVATVEPVAAEGAALLQLAGPATGALVGEAGLRPNTHGGSGWEWFAGLRLDAVALPLELVDPLLGTRSLVQPLLPALTLVDWSLG